MSRIGLSFLPGVTNYPFCAIITHGDAYMIENTERLPDAVSLIPEWYSAGRRLLPWRQDPTPYHTWIAEIMLQQTRIEAVIPYYERFLRELPDVSALAAVPEDRLLKLWEGLGYYSRARNLKKAALLLMEHYGGELPASAAELRKLPGIGDYTAGSIASISFGLPEPAVDGNVLRVMTRLLACADDIAAPATKRAVTELLRAHYPSGDDAALLTEGIMELGETVCLPNGSPLCERCPLRGLCLAHQEGKELSRCFFCAAVRASRSASAPAAACWPACGSFPTRTAASRKKPFSPSPPAGRPHRAGPSLSAVQSMSSPMWSGI